MEVYTVFNNLKVSKNICKFHIFFIKIPVGFFLEVDMLVLKFIFKWKESRLSNQIKKEAIKESKLTLSGLKTCYKVRVIKTLSDRNTEKQNRI
jgi:hypothetical protein